MISGRADQVVWAWLYLDDLDADFARFFRRDWHEHSGPLLFSRAARLFAYGGAVASLALRLSGPEPDPNEPPDILDALNDPAYAGMVEVG